MLASSRGPRAAAGVRGRDKSLPYDQRWACANRTAATTRTAAGRDALIPPEPALPQTPTGGYGIRPYETARSAAKRGTAPSAVSQTSVGDDACIVPGTSRRRKVSGRAMALPYKPSEHDRPNRTAATTRTAVGRDALIPPDPAPPQTPTGGYGIRPYETARPAANRGAAPSAISQTSVGDDACIVPRTSRRRKACGRAMALPYKPSEHDRPTGQPQPPGRP